MKLSERGVLGDGDCSGSRVEKKRLNEKDPHPYFCNFNRTWNYLAPCSGSKRPHANRHHFQYGLGSLCNYTVGYCLSH